MRKIFKYKVETGSITRIMLNPGAKILHVAFNAGAVRFWTEVDPNKGPQEERRFCIVGTGMEIPDVLNRYIGTAFEVIGEETLVWHLYELVKVVSAKRPSTDIFTIPGRKVRFIGKGGLASDIQNAVEAGFVVGNEYTISSMFLAKNCMTLQFEEIAGEYKGTMFENIGVPIEHLPMGVLEAEMIQHPAAVGKMTCTDPMLRELRDNPLVGDMFDNFGDEYTVVELPFVGGVELISLKWVRKSNPDNNGKSNVNRIAWLQRYTPGATNIRLVPRVTLKP